MERLGHPRNCDVCRRREYSGAVVDSGGGGICGVRVDTPPVRCRPRKGHDEEAPGDGDLTEEDAAVEEELELPEPPGLLNHFLQVVTRRLHVGIDLSMDTEMYQEAKHWFSRAFPAKLGKSLVGKAREEKGKEVALDEALSIASSRN